MNEMECVYICVSNIQLPIATINNLAVVVYSQFIGSKCGLPKPRLASKQNTDFNTIPRRMSVLVLRLPQGRAWSIARRKLLQLMCILVECL